jgi:hypothetical protein
MSSPSRRSPLVAGQYLEMNLFANICWRLSISRWIKSSSAREIRREAGPVIRKPAQGSAVQASRNDGPLRAAGFPVIDPADSSATGSTRDHGPERPAPGADRGHRDRNPPGRTARRRDLNGNRFCPCVSATGSRRGPNPDRSTTAAVRVGSPRSAREEGRRPALIAKRVGRPGHGLRSRGSAQPAATHRIRNPEDCFRISYPTNGPVDPTRIFD